MKERNVGSCQKVKKNYFDTLKLLAANQIPKNLNKTALIRTTKAPQKLQMDVILFSPARTLFKAIKEGLQKRYSDS